MQANVKDFDAISKQQLFFLFHQMSFKVASGCSAWFALTSQQISSWLTEKCVRKWSQEVLFCAYLVTPRLGQGQWKWYKMVEVSGAYMHGRNENNWLKGFNVLSNTNIFAMHEGQLASPSKHDYYVDLYVTHMNVTEELKTYALFSLHSAYLYTITLNNIIQYTYIHAYSYMYICV